MSHLLKNLTKTKLQLDTEDTFDVDLDIDDISAGVDVEIPETTQKSGPWYTPYQGQMGAMATETSPVSLQEYSSPHMDSIKPINYCPVYIQKSDAGKLVIVAYITGKITDLNEYIDLVDILEIVGPEDEVYIFIDSPGGYIASGATIASSISTCKAVVTGVARGLCASAGSLIWSACHKQIATPMANFMYHMSAHEDGGNSETIRQNAALQVEYVRKCLLSVALKKGHITEEELELICLCKDNVFISSQVMNQRINGNGGQTNA